MSGDTIPTKSALDDLNQNIYFKQTRKLVSEYSGTMQQEKDLFFIHAQLQDVMPLAGRAIVEGIFLPGTLLLPPNEVAFIKGNFQAKDGRQFEMTKIDIKYAKNNWYVYSVGYTYSEKQM